MLAFHRSDGGEGPARSAHSLILNGIHSAFLDPVDFSWKILEWRVVSDKVVFKDSGLVVEEGLPFLFGPVGELVVADRRCAVFLVEFGDLTVGADELNESELEVGKRLVLLAVLGSPL